MFYDPPRLRVLDLGGNDLSTLPEGMFSGLENLRLLRLQNNPGSPFLLTIELERTDNTDKTAPGPATIVVTLAEGAPFDMNVTLSAQAGTLSATRATILKGRTVSKAITVTQSGAEPVTISLDSAPEQPPANPDGSLRYQGIETAVGVPLVVFGPSNPQGE